MSPIVTPARPRAFAQPTFASEPTRRERSAQSAIRDPQAPALATHDKSARPVLLAGAEQGGREQPRAEIGRALPHPTTFAEADAVCDVLERAPASRLVILAGDLGDGSAESLVRLLGLRHPELPVVSIETLAPRPADLRIAA
jgi:hypothetical protein